MPQITYEIIDGDVFRVTMIKGQRCLFNETLVLKMTIEGFYRRAGAENPRVLVKYIEVIGFDASENELQGNLKVDEAAIDKKKLRNEAEYHQRFQSLINDIMTEQLKGNNMTAIRKKLDPIIDALMDLHGKISVEEGIKE